MVTQNKKRNTAANNTKASLNNYMLNVLIFLLTAVIIYLLYSLFIKISNNDDADIEVRTITNKPAEIIQVEVLNGCGVSGVADRFTDFLRDNNVDVVKTGNYVRFDVDETIVIDRIGNLSNAKYIAKLLKVKPGNAFPQLNNDYFVDVTIIIGRDYFKQSPIKKD